MNGIKFIVNSFLPDVLKSVPIPETVTGLVFLSPKQWLGLIAFDTVVIGLSYSVYQTILKYKNSGRGSRINQTIDLHLDKVVHSYEINNIDLKKVYCRCWKSAKFPFCDGAHNKHNLETGDNVGPLIINKE